MQSGAAITAAPMRSVQKPHKAWCSRRKRVDSRRPRYRRDPSLDTCRPLQGCVHSVVTLRHPGGGTCLSTCVGVLGTKLTSGLDDSWCLPPLSPGRRSNLIGRVSVLMSILAFLAQRATRTRLTTIRRADITARRCSRSSSIGLNRLAPRKGLPAYSSPAPPLAHRHSAA